MSRTAWEKAPPNAVWKRGDTAPAIRERLLDGTGATVDLTGATVRFRGTFPAAVDAAQAIDSAAVVVAPPTSGVVSYSPVAGDTDVAGELLVELEGHVRRRGDRDLPIGRVPEGSDPRMRTGFRPCLAHGYAHDQRDCPARSKWARPPEHHTARAARERAALLEAKPSCECWGWCGLHSGRCPNRSTIRDHVVNLARGGIDEPSSTQALCAPCHDVKTGREGLAGFLARR